MALHHALHDLVGRLGPGILDDADTLLGTLDDYLEDSDADPAALELLAAAVRHGALARLAGLVDNGAAPTAAVATAGADLSGRRGADERGARWAVAALGYAAGRLEEQVAAVAHADWQAGLRTRQGAPLPPPPPPVPASVPPPVPAPVPTPDPDPTDAVRRTAVEHDARDEHDTVPRRRRRALPALLVVLLAVAAGLAGWLVLQDRDPAGAGRSPDRNATPSPTTDARADGSDGQTDGSDEETDGQSEGQSDGQTEGAGSGGFVAYASRAGGTSRVRVLDLGSGTVRTVAAEGSASQPSVSADGRTVAFVLETGEGKRLAVSRGAGAPLLLDVGREPSDPAIAPDGSAVAYVTQTDHGKDVSVRRLSGTTAAVVAGGTADEFDPVWTADGTGLAYVLRGSSDDSIVLVDAASGVELSRTATAGHAASPALSPSGDEVAYVARVQGNAEVVVTGVGAGLAEPDNASQSAETEVAVAWLADGRLVSSAPGRGLAAITTASPVPEMLTSGAGDSL